MRKQTFRNVPDNYVFYVLLDPNDGTLWRAWLAPAAELSRLANSNPKNLVITPNPAMSSADRYSTWRCESLEDVARRLIGDF